MTTGVGCCKAGSATQVAEEASCQASRGNMDCVAASLELGAAGGFASALDACGCGVGFGWSV